MEAQRKGSLASDPLTAPLRWYRGAVESDADEWDIRARLAWIVLAVPLVAVAAAVALLPFRSAFLWATKEDSIVEWLQFACILATAVAFALLAVRSRRRRPWFAVLAVMIVLGALFVAGEEISWGQRIFGWATPEALEDVNRQGESNIHNILSVQRAFGIAELLAAAYGLFVPLAVAVLALRRQLPDWRYLVVPSLCLGSAFAIALAYRAVRLTVLSEAGQTVNRFGEVAELLLYAALLAHAAMALRRVGTTGRRESEGAAGA